MDQLLDAITARFQAQQAAGHIQEYHDDEPTSFQQYPVAFVAPQGPTVMQFTTGSPGKVLTTWQMDLYYCVPLADRRPAYRRLAQIAPLIIRDWLQHRRLEGIARNTQVGEQAGKGQFARIKVGDIPCFALKLILLVETEELV